MFKVIQTNAGFAIQNVKTYAIVFVYPSVTEATRVCLKLNK